jgi:hypothetical protein
MKIINVIAVFMMLFAMPVMASDSDKVPATTVPATENIEEMTPEKMAKVKLLEALVDFMDMSKEALQEGGKMAKDGIKGGVNMAKQQIPLVLEELVIIRRVEVILYFLSCIIIIFLLHYAAKKACQSQMAQSKEMVHFEGDEIGSLGSVTRNICSIVKWSGTAIVLWVIIYHIRDWCLPWAAPRVYLIEYAVALLKTIKN